MYINYLRRFYPTSYKKFALRFTMYIYVLCHIIRLFAEGYIYYNFSDLRFSMNYNRICSFSLFPLHQKTYRAVKPWLHSVAGKSFLFFTLSFLELSPTALQALYAVSSSLILVLISHQ